MKSALNSVRVVELTEALAGPYCAMLLGDLGADVIKVERKRSGDQSRGWGPPWWSLVGNTDISVRNFRIAGNTSK
jgi:glutaryl-CoA transferase